MITSATPHAALATKIKALFGGSGVANWSFVENIPAGTGAGQSGSASYSIDVYKCAGSGTDANDAATDWYVAWRLPVTDGAVSSNFNVFEDYEGGTNKRFKRPVAGPAVQAPTGTGFWRSDTYAAAASVVGVQQETIFTLNTTGFSYWIKLTKNGIWVTCQVGSTLGTHIALLGDTMVASGVATDSCPLFAHGAGGGSGIEASREPGVTDGTKTKWNYGECAPWTLLAGSNAPNNNDLFQGNKVALSRICVLRTGGAGVINLIGAFRALLKPELILCFQTGGTVNIGDTIVINGVTYVVMWPGTGTFGAFIVTNAFVLVTPQT